MAELLDSINGPDDLAGMDLDQLAQLCDELRRVIVETVAHNGGHLGASLGVVELTVALHHVFRSPRDKIVWDVGHQAYGHKLLTGRRDRFHTLRQAGGISGFPKREESPHDAFGVGHASTSISAALGMARARDLRGDDHAVVAVIGDGALTGGIAYEGLNNAGQSGTDMVVILNDNAMSISPNVGAVARYLTRITSGQLYNRFEADLWRLLGKLPRGRTAQKLASRIKEGLKQLVVPTILFEELGFRYYGPIDGHDLPLVVQTLRSVRRIKGPVLVHLVTSKGKGYAFAEKERARYHGVGRFDPKVGLRPKPASGPGTWTQAFGESLLRAARRDDRIVAITAAMPDGTGLSRFRDEFPDRFFDVGIAEQHAVTFAGGLACEGMRPVVAIYSTFLQRAYDQVIHDIALQHLPVVFALDRGGLVGEDGPTHHGAFDLSYLRVVPGLTLMAPADEAELQGMLAAALAREDGPSALRYPRGAAPGVPLAEAAEPLPTGKGVVVTEGEDVALLAVGSQVAVAREAADLLAASGIHPTVVNMRFLKPLDDDLLADVFHRHRLVFTLEENSVVGGLGAAVLEWQATREPHAPVPVHLIGLPDRFIEHGEREELLVAAGLDAAGVAATVADHLRQRGGLASGRAQAGA